MHYMGEYKDIGFVIHNICEGEEVCCFIYCILYM